MRDAATPFYGHLLTAMQERAAAHGYRVVMTTGSGLFSVVDERGALETLVQLRVEGLVVCSGLLPVSEVTSFAGRMPLVVAGRPETHESITSVFCDEQEGGAGLADHLLGLGHRSVAVLRPTQEQSLRMAPLTFAMARRLRERGACVLELAAGRADDVDASLEEVLTHREVTALMTPSDHYAQSVLESMQRRGLGAPTDLSVTGYDGLGSLTTPLIGLTTWVQLIARIDERAIDALVAHLDGQGAPDHRQCRSGVLSCGRTTGPPGTAAR